MSTLPDLHLKHMRSESESGWGLDVLDPCIQLASIKSRSPRRRELPRNQKGAVAQLGERLICTQEVAGSIPTSSTSVGNTPGPVAQMARAHP